MKLTKIETGNFKLDGGAMFGVVPKVMWNKLYPSDENNLCNWAMRCLLVEHEDRKILIDTGMGDKQSENFFRHYHPNGDASLKKSIAQAGLSPQDITDVIITHMHFDHVGGAVDKTTEGKLITAFPKAKYWISKAQWDWANNPNQREKASFLPENFVPIQESGQLQLVEQEMELMPGIELKLFDGHTQGQLIPYIRYQNTTLVYGGDLMPSAAHIPMPYVMSYDTKPLITLEDKKKLYAEVIPNKYAIFLEHDLYNECCTVKNTEKGPRLDKTFTLQEFVEQ